MRIEKYEENLRRKWDQFVLRESVNGTIFHTRNFLNYHPEERFDDTSIILRDGNTIACVLPACKDDHGSFSHAGSAYGGPVVHPDYYRVKRLSEIIECILKYYEGKIEMRIAPSIFGRKLNDPIVYMLGRTHKVVRELGVYVDLRNDNILENFESRKERYVRTSLGDEIVAYETDKTNDYKAFYKIVKAGLARHGVDPTHTLDEFIELKHRLDNRQMLVVGCNNDGNIVAGSWLIKASSIAWHNLYTHKNYDKGGHEATPCVFYKSMELAKKEGAKYFNIGISTEDKGKKMNIGLFDFKESLGGETINRYQLLLDE